MKTSTDRILTTHAGSLVRSPDVVEAMMRAYVGRPLPPRDLQAALSEGVTDVVSRQAATGIDVVDDGEFGKSNWISYVIDRFEGVSPRPPGGGGGLSFVYPNQERFAEFYREHTRQEYTQWLPHTATWAEYERSSPGFTVGVCTGPIRYNPEPVARDIANLKAALEGVKVEEAFMPVVAPCSVESVANAHYATQEEFLFAAADALKQEYRMIVDAGFVLQVDDAMLPMARFMRFPQSYEDFLAYGRIRMEALNYALEGIPEDRVRYHVCFGSHNVPHISDPPLTEIVDLVLSVNAQAYSIEASNPRHEHEWKVWEDVKLPDGKVLIPGVVGHATNVVEHPELVAMRLVNFARLVGRERVIAGTDCGFSQGWNVMRVHPEVQWAKLEALVAGARLASQALWGSARAAAA